MTIVNDNLESMTEGAANREDGVGEGEVFLTVNQMDIAMLDSDDCYDSIELSKAIYGLESDSAQGFDQMENFPLENISDHSNERDLLKIAMETIHEKSESELGHFLPVSNKKSPEKGDVKKKQGECFVEKTEAQQDDEDEDDEEIIQFLTDCFDNRQSQISHLSPEAVMSKDLEKKRKNFDNKRQCENKKRKQVGDVTISHCQTQVVDNDRISSACSKFSKASEPQSLTSMPFEESVVEKLGNLPKELIQYFRPNTKDGVFQAIEKVAIYLQEEEKWERKIARRNKINQNRKTSSKSKINRPVLTLDVYSFMKLGILPWEMKNRKCRPRDDTSCHVRIPDDIKVTVLRYRSWYPTMHDKLYCFENHSKYLFDIELFGCWECIRKYFNEIYKWASNNGFVLREIRV